MHLINQVKYLLHTPETPKFSLKDCKMYHTHDTRPSCTSAFLEPKRAPSSVFIGVGAVGGFLVLVFFAVVIINILKRRKTQKRLAQIIGLLIIGAPLGTCRTIQAITYTLTN